MPQRLDFAQWEFANVQLAPIKLKLSTGVTTTIIAGGLAAETAARIAGDNALTVAIVNEAATRFAADAAEAGTRAAADTALQNQITALQQPAYAPQMLLGGM